MSTNKQPFAKVVLQLHPSGKLTLESVTKLQSLESETPSEITKTNDLPTKDTQTNRPPNKKTKLRYAIYEAQGPRDSMEDAHHIAGDEGLFCIFDGHGGRKAADFAARRFPEILSKHPLYKSDPVVALREAVLSTEEEFLEWAKKEELNDGTTLVVGLVSGDKLYVANVGDSEALVCRGESSVNVTTVHNPAKNTDEIVRVQAVGGRLYNNRVGHPHFNVRFFNIAVSRAIGDLLYKSPGYTNNKVSGLTADPDVSVTELGQDDKFLLLACDGVWDVLTQQEAVDFVLEKLKETEDPQVICKAIVDEALNRHSMDNVTACLVLFS
eukprot:TRINITY_DN3275_c0_g1_i1.p1 TRINITY_DN3275_c0_g1~~TRINITY_DN3275_c0_g1_i1.p1  ORF type:complete len:338 (+),score=69.28 TRINITY_DN3275_c0_g1_i1:40-1014(+)